LNPTVTLEHNDRDEASGLLYVSFESDCTHSLCLLCYHPQFYIFSAAVLAVFGSWDMSVKGCSAFLHIAIASGLIPAYHTCSDSEVICETYKLLTSLLSWDIVSCTETSLCMSPSCYAVPCGDDI
jgi:hypothetical protein